MLNKNEFEEERDRELADAIEKTMDAEVYRPHMKPRRFKDYYREWQRIRLTGDIDESGNLSSETKSKTDWYIIPLKNLKDL